MHTGRLNLVRLLMAFIPETRGFGLKRLLYRFCGVQVGRNVRICSSAKILGNGGLSIGSDTWIGHDVMIQCSGKISIGCCVDIAPRVLISTGSHVIDPIGEHVAGVGYNGDIVIDDGVWLGMGVIVIPPKPGDVRRIGRKAVLGAGAVIVSDIASGELAVGVPARTIKKVI